MNIVSKINKNNPKNPGLKYEKNKLKKVQKMPKGFFVTRDKSEIDLIIDAPFGVIPIEIKLGHKIKKGMLTALKTFLKDTNAQLGILVNNSDKIEFPANNIIQIPVHYF